MGCAAAGPVVTIGGGGGGIAAAIASEWIQLTDVEQEDGAPYDPGGMATEAAFDGDVFSATSDVNHVTLRAGYRHELLRWTRSVRDVLPAFDPALHLMQLAVRPTAGIGGGGTDDWGIFAGVLSRGTSGIATLDGACAYVVRFNANPSIRVGMLGRTGVSSIVDVGDCDGMVATFGWNLLVTNLTSAWASVHGRRTGGTYMANGSSGVAGNSIAAPLDLAAWRLHTGLIHNSTDAAAVAFAWRVYVRLLLSTPMNW